jgi:hypothetical protein
MKRYRVTDKEVRWCGSVKQLCSTKVLVQGERRVESLIYPKYLLSLL